ncbi:MAG: nuclear transport factor 2 family protein [Gammaproteobacteria bacterium]|jgi:steroid delta-isomerase-like uncharacterized protein|nr:nuclear transport factor 2 family protein [Gammaproteobacteria bacterium]
MQTTESIILHYYDYFNKRDTESFLALLDNNVIHDINQGDREIGIDAFTAFMERMNNAYEEKIKDIIVMTNQDGSRAAAEFTVEGIYKSSDKGLPIAKNQHYELRCGAFFEIKQGKITRVTNYYNLQDWLKQVEK